MHEPRMREGINDQVPGKKCSHPGLTLAVSRERRLLGKVGQLLLCFLQEEEEGVNSYSIVSFHCDVRRVANH